MHAVSERSFSALRRIKSYLRATMSQERLNHIMVLHIHRHLTDRICYIEIGNEFSKGCSHREAFFGNFFQQTFSVIIAGTLLCSMHACYCSLDTDFFSE